MRLATKKLLRSKNSNSPDSSELSAKDDKVFINEIPSIRQNQRVPAPSFPMKDFNSDDLLYNPEVYKSESDLFSNRNLSKEERILENNPNLIENSRFKDSYENYVGESFKSQKDYNMDWSSPEEENIFQYEENPIPEKKFLNVMPGFIAPSGLSTIPEEKLSELEETLSVSNPQGKNDRYNPILVAPKLSDPYSNVDSKDSPRIKQDGSSFDLISGPPKLQMPKGPILKNSISNETSRWKPSYPMNMPSFPSPYPNPGAQQSLNAGMIPFCNIDRGGLPMPSFSNPNLNSNYYGIPPPISMQSNNSLPNPLNLPQSSRNLNLPPNNPPNSQSFSVIPQPLSKGGSNIPLNPPNFPSFGSGSNIPLNFPPNISNSRPNPFINNRPGPPQNFSNPPNLFNSSIIPPPPPGCIAPPIPRNNPYNNNRLDSNIMEIAFEQLKHEQIISTGDPSSCTNCKAFFSSRSKLIENTWTCEFCSSENLIELDEEEIPKENKILYVLETISQQAAKVQKQSHDKTVIFCIDISGSMCVTVPIMGKFKFKTNRSEELQRELYGIVGPEWMAIDRNDVTYVSRLECVQAAIETQLNNLYTVSPSSKVGIITFNNEVSVIGDGTNDQIIAGDNLFNFARLVTLFENKFSEVLSAPIKLSKEILCKKILDLQESGSTALGPALLVSVILASQGGAGSKVILCTDGVANNGLGNLEFDEDIEFYQRLSQIAQDKSVEVSVISISDDDCRLDALSKVVENTGGDLSKINPERLNEDFANILANEIYATNVKISVRLPKELKFMNCEEENLKEFRILEKNFGNVNNESLFTVEFQVCDESTKTAPIQVAIEYKDMEGNKYVLVHTELFEVSDNQEEVIKEADFSIFAINTQLQSGNMIRQGNLFGANENINKWTNLMQRNVSSMPQANSLGMMKERTTTIQEKLNTEIYNNSVLSSPMNNYRDDMPYYPNNPPPFFNYGIPPPPLPSNANFGPKLPPPINPYPGPSSINNAPQGLGLFLQSPFYLNNPALGRPNLGVQGGIGGLGGMGGMQGGLGGLGGMGGVGNTGGVPGINNINNSGINPGLGGNPSSLNYSSGISPRFPVPNQQPLNNNSRVSDDLLSEARKISKSRK